MSRINQINSLLQKEIADFVGQNLPLENFLITIKNIDTSPDLKNVNIFVSVLPDKFFGSALKSLRKINHALNSHLRQKLKLRKIPKFNWKVDPSEKAYSEIEKILSEIKDE